MTHAFVGRHKELERLKDLLHRPIASSVVVKGRRRIGKTRLIEEFAQGQKFVMLAGLAPTPEITAQHQRDEFARGMSRIFHMPPPFSTDWSDLFWHLGQQTQKHRVIILLDEISWMGFEDPTFLSKLKNAWDQYFKKNPKLILVLCGSISSWIEDNIISSTGFVGRIDLVLNLDELSLSECNEFLWKKNKQVSSYEKFKILSVTGGVPRYLETILTKETAEINIKKLCFTKGGFLYNEFDKIFHDLFGKRSEVYKKILLCLIHYPHAELNDIFVCMGIKKTGVIVEYLKDLIEAGFVRRDYAWSLSSRKTSKLSCFRISDNYMRFYLKYILPNEQNIERDGFENKTLTTLPGWGTIMGLQFENLVLSNRKNIFRQLNIDPNEIINDNPYFQRGTADRAGCQIDYMIQTRFNCLYICEIKFSKNPIKDTVISEMKDKISRLILPKNFSYRPVLIHVNGIESDVEESDFFAKIIDFSDMLNGKV